MFYMYSVVVYTHSQCVFTLCHLKNGDPFSQSAKTTKWWTEDNGHIILCCLIFRYFRMLFNAVLC